MQKMPFKIVIDIKIFFTRPDKLQDKYKNHLDFCLGCIDLGGQSRHHCKKSFIFSIVEAFLDFYAFEEIKTHTNAQTFLKTMMRDLSQNTLCFFSYKLPFK